MLNRGALKQYQTFLPKRRTKLRYLFEFF